MILIGDKIKPKYIPTDIPAVSNRKFYLVIWVGRNTMLISFDQDEAYPLEDISLSEEEEDINLCSISSAKQYEKENPDRTYGYLSLDNFTEIKGYRSVPLHQTKD